MSPNELLNLKRMIVMTAAYYGRELKDDVIKMMASDLQDLPFDDVIQAYHNFRRDPKNRVFPLPAQIRDLVQPTMTKDAEAREILGRIKDSVRLFGYMGGGVMEYVGPIGWRFIQEAGGWHYLCTETNFTNDPSFLAQARERLIDMVRFGVPSRSVDKPALTHEQKIQLERHRQNEMVDEWKEKIARAKPDPNEGYLSKSKEDQRAFMADFIAKLNAQQNKGDSNG